MVEGIGVKDSLYRNPNKVDKKSSYIWSLNLPGFLSHNVISSFCTYSHHDAVSHVVTQPVRLSSQAEPTEPLDLNLQFPQLEANQVSVPISTHLKVLL